MTVLMSVYFIKKYYFNNLNIYSMIDMVNDILYSLKQHCSLFYEYNEDIGSSCHLPAV